MKHWKPFATGGKYTCNECPRSIDNYPDILSLQMRIHELEHELELTRLPRPPDIGQPTMRFPPGTPAANKLVDASGLKGEDNEQG